MSALADVVATYRRWLHFPDPVPLYVVLATVIANLMEDGDSVWLVIVSGSSRGKTEILAGLSKLEYVRVTGSLTEASLLSGTPKKERSKNATGGLLRELPPRGAVLVVKDFGAILSMPRDKRAVVLQALRDMYDGRYTRDVGTGGGERLEWRGQVGLIAAATGQLDRAQAAMAALGERWLTLRLDGDERQMVRAALRQSATGAMRDELAEVVESYLAAVRTPRLSALTGADESLVTALAILTARARSPIERNSYGAREIELVPQTEGPPRLARQLHKLLTAMQAMELPRDTIRSTLVRIGLDSIPSPRREALELLLGNEHTTTQARLALGLPQTTTERTLEDLAALGLVSVQKAGERERSANLWRAKAEVLQLWREVHEPHNEAETASPGTSRLHALKEREYVDDDISGEGNGLVVDESDDDWWTVERAREAQA